MFVFPTCILRDNFDALFYFENLGNPFLYDDSYPYYGWTWDFHPCHLRFIDFIFDSCVNWEHKNLIISFGIHMWIWPHHEVIYVEMESLSSIQPYIIELHSFWESCIDTLFCIGSDKLPWFCEFSIFYDDVSFLVIL